MIQKKQGRTSFGAPARPLTQATMALHRSLPMIASSYSKRKETWPMATMRRPWAAPLTERTCKPHI